MQNYISKAKTLFDAARDEQRCNPNIKSKVIAKQLLHAKSIANRFIQVAFDTADLSTATGHTVLGEALKKYEALLDTMEIHWTDPQSRDNSIPFLMIRAHAGLRNFDAALNLLEMIIKSEGKVAGRHFHPIIQGLLVSVIEEPDLAASIENLQLAVWLHEDCMRRFSFVPKYDTETENMFFNIATIGTIGGSEVASNHALAILRHRSAKWREVPLECTEQLLTWMRHTVSPATSKARFVVTTNATISKDGYCTACKQTLEPPELSSENHANLLAVIRKALAPPESGKLFRQQIDLFDAWLDGHADAGAVIDGNNIMYNPIYSSADAFEFNSRLGISRTKKKLKWNDATNTETRGVKEMNASRVCIGNIPQDVTQDVLEGFFSQGGRIPNVTAILQREPETHNGKGEVHFRLREDAAKAVELINGSICYNNKVDARMAGTTPKGFSKVKVSNIHFDTNWLRLKNHFVQSGTAEPHFVMLYDIYDGAKLLHDGRGEVQFGSEQDAHNAVKTFNGSKLNGNELHVRMDVRWQESIKMRWMGDRYQTAVDYYQSRGVKAIGVCMQHILRGKDNNFLKHYRTNGSLYMIPSKLSSKSDHAIDDLFVLYAALKLGLKKPGIKIVAGDQFRDHLEMTRHKTVSTELSEEFQRWLFGHLCPVEISLGGFNSFPYNSAKMKELKPVPLFNSIVQEQNGSWHIPIGDSSERSRYENSLNPNRW